MFFHEAILYAKYIEMVPSVLLGGFYGIFVLRSHLV
jgi:hypothetical protein